MAQKLADLGRYFDPGLTLTVLGREYVLPLPSAELGLWCRLVASVAGEVTAASTEAEVQDAVGRVEQLPELPGSKDLTLAERVLGNVHEMMIRDKVPDPYIQFCGTTAYLWVLAGQDKAAEYWVSGGRPEATSPANREARRAEARVGRTSTAKVPETLTPAPTSGTTSRKKSSASAPAKASRGRRSSTAG